MLYIVLRSQPLHILTTSSNMTYNLKADNDVICQCGCMISKYYMSEHLKTTKHEREMIGRENIKVINQYQYNNHKQNNDFFFT